jgi:hypothetical protein
MFVTFPRHGTRFHSKLRWKLYFAWTSIFTGRQMAIVTDQHWCESQICEFKSW